MSGVCTVIGKVINGMHNGVQYSITSLTTGTIVDGFSTTYSASAEGVRVSGCDSEDEARTLVCSGIDKAVAQ